MVRMLWFFGAAANREADNIVLRACENLAQVEGDQSNACFPSEGYP